MVQNTQNHWGSGIYPPSEILNIRKHNVQWLRSALAKGLNKVGVSFPSPENGNTSNFRNFVLASI
jgi:hypothetical protein